MAGIGGFTEGSRRKTAATRVARVHWPRRWGGVVLVGVLAFAAFAAIGEDVLHHETSAVDARVRGWILAHRAPAAHGLFASITTIGSVTPMIVYAVIASAFLWRRERRIVATTVLFAPVAAVVAYLGLKGLFARVRPSNAGNLIEGTYAFPSAHATTSAAICCTLAYVFWREGLLRGRPAVIVAIGIPLLVGVSRLYLDAHWATDILGGWSAGVCIAAVSAALYNSTGRRGAHPDPIEETT
ncbi:MAG: phosphatase PAP2 family protein [bacterium]